MPVRKYRRPALAAQSLADRILHYTRRDGTSRSAQTAQVCCLACLCRCCIVEALMIMRISQLNGANSAGYFDRLPEKLVLEGYRRWPAGFETGSIIPWEMTWGL